MNTLYRLIGDLFLLARFSGSWGCQFLLSLAALPTHYRHNRAFAFGAAREAGTASLRFNTSLLVSLLWIAAVITLAWWQDPSALALGMAVPKRKDPPDISYHEGKQIMLPGDPDKMKLDSAISWLTKIRDDQETIVAVHEEVPGYDPLDVAFALSRAIKKIYGFAETLKPGMFEHPPTMIDVKIDVDTTVQVPWGKFSLPNVSGYIQTAIKPWSDPAVFTLRGETKKKDAEMIRRLMDETRAQLRESSIYLGKVVRFAMKEDENDDLKQEPLDFVSVESANPDHLIFSADIQEQVSTTIFTPLTKRALCSALDVPFKRGVCLMGPYGTGKTLAVYVAAKYAKAAGVTTILVEDAEHLPYAVRFARQYSPALVICEDVDRVTKERDETCNDIMDALDGAEAKDRDVMVLFTSNDGESIHPAMRRPGRIDTFIKVLPPDSDAVERLLRLYGDGRIDPAENLRDVCELLAGQIPAVIREVVERAKLAAIARVDPDLPIHQQMIEASELWADDLMISARRMLMQIDLFSDKANQSIGAALAVAAHTLGSQANAIAQVAHAEMQSPRLAQYARTADRSQN